MSSQRDPIRHEYGGWGHRDGVDAVARFHKCFRAHEARTRAQEELPTSVALGAELSFLAPALLCSLGTAKKSDPGSS
jgi:hypothetical protein